MAKTERKEYDQWRDIRHFKPVDFGCKCERCRNAGLPKINPELVLALDSMSNDLGRPLAILKAVACDSPYHKAGNAVDVATPDNQFRFAVVKAAQDYGINRIGIGVRGYIHLELAPEVEPALWLEQAPWQK